MKALARSSLPRPPIAWLAGLLLLLFWLQAVSAARHWSQTSDELPHVTAGYAYNRFQDFRMQPENGNLPQRVHGLAPLALGAQFPLDESRWRQSDYWQLGWDFFYGLGNPTDRMLLGARALNALFGVALGAFLFLVAHRLTGPAGGLLALGFFVFCPNFLAHSALATSDLAGTLCLTLAAWLFWRHLQRREAASGAWAGLVSGLALTAKFNGLLLAPIYALLAGIDALATPGARGRRLATNLGLCLLQAAAGILVVWAFYGGRFSAAGDGVPPLDRFNWPWAPPEDLPGWKMRLAVALRTAHLLPEAYLQGLMHVFAGESARPAFLAGEYSLQGWGSFFPTVFLVKTPLSLLAALGLALALAVHRGRGHLRTGLAQALRTDWLPLATVALVTWGAAVSSHLNIGHRHILAVYPLLFVGVGSLARHGRLPLVAGLFLLAGLAAESLAIRPHYLAFFNPIAGGPARAHRLVVDSSLDWGQALPALRDCLATQRRPGEPVYLSYFGSAWPPHYGVKPTHFLPAVTIVTPAQAPYAYRPGLYCLSATSLAEVYSPYRGPWRASWDRRLHDPATPPEEADLLRFSRLCKYLQSRPPDAQAGYAILIYRLDAADLAAALHGPVSGW